MSSNKIIVTGGAGFVGSNLCIYLKSIYRDAQVVAFDNLSRNGSQINVERLKKNGVSFVYGDVRRQDHLENITGDVLIECSAVPSVLAGIGESPMYALHTNVSGAINCFEWARKNGAKIIFLSSSRVYPIEKINSLKYKEANTRFELLNNQEIPGVTDEGVSEQFPLAGPRTLYGASKLSAELLLEEFGHAYNVSYVINRCGVLAGPWQMGKVDQGFIAWWLTRFIYSASLQYIGFGGKGKQVRDILSITDLFNLIHIQIESFDTVSGQTFNVGGGKNNTISLCELTSICKKVTGLDMEVSENTEQRYGDIRIYYTNNSHVTNITGWKPEKTVSEIVEETYFWISHNQSILKSIFV